MKKNQAKKQAKDNFGQAQKAADTSVKMTVTDNGSPVGKDHGDGIAKLS